MSMEIKQITTDDLRRMEDRGGLILQGTGGDLNEWVEGITRQLTEAGILKKGSAFQKVYTFKNEGLTNLLFDFEGVNLSPGKLAGWRLATREGYGSMWLEDYVENRLGGFVQGEQREQEKPDCELIGQDSNVFNLIGIASRTLRENGMENQAKEMWERITGGDCQSFEQALGIIGEYVNITGPKEPGMEMEGY